MDKRKLQRYEIAVYFILVCLAALLAIFSNSISQETVKAITINLASELLAVGFLFFILKQIFLLSEDDNIAELKRELKKLENLGLSSGAIEAENRSELKRILDCLAKLESINLSSGAIEARNRDDLQKIVNDITNLAFLLSVNDQVSVNDQKAVLAQLITIRSHLQDVSENTSNLVSQVAKEVGKRQKELLSAVEKRFSDEILKSRSILTTAIERELTSLAKQPNTKDNVLDRLVNLVEQAMGKMGDFQRTSIREESKVAFSNIEKSISKPINDIASEVQEIKKRVDQLALPPSKE